MKKERGLFFNMINYITFSYNKPPNLTTAQLHLFEHSIAQKITNLIKKTFPNQGIVLNAETFLDNCIIEIYFTNEELHNALLEEIGMIYFSDADSDMIEREKKIILLETAEIDLTTEELALYSSLELFTSNNILSMYDQEIDLNNIVEHFNLLLNECRITYFKDNKLSVFKNAPAYYYSTKAHKAEWALKDENIVGYLKFDCLDFKDIIMKSFISFIYGKNEDSFISNHLLKPYDLYLGYTLDLYIDNSYAILFLVETNQESKEMFLKNPELFKSKFIFIDKEFVKLKEAFKTYICLTDNILININKFFSKFIMPEEEISISQIIDCIDEIQLSDINKLFGDVYAKKL